MTVLDNMFAGALRQVGDLTDDPIYDARCAVCRALRLDPDNIITRADMSPPLTRLFFAAWAEVQVMVQSGDIGMQNIINTVFPVLPDIPGDTYDPYEQMLQVFVLYLLNRPDGLNVLFHDMTVPFTPEDFA